MNPDTLDVISALASRSGRNRLALSLQMRFRSRQEDSFGAEVVATLRNEFRMKTPGFRFYRIDHFLGKEIVQNLFALRFANGIFEPVWNRNYIDHVQITAAETLGMEGRGGYYETVGAMRDMVQNHLLQLCALVAIEPPAEWNPRAVRKINPVEVERYAVRGLYREDTIGGERVFAHREEEEVAADSPVATYAVLKLHVDNLRWAGVPFYLRSGKRLVEMVHNGIEYGLMAAYAEGLSVLRAANIGRQRHDPDAETTPLRDPEHYQYDLNLGDIAELWRRGSVIASWLLDLTADALARDSQLSQFAGRVSDSGEGRWTIKAAIDEGVPVPVLTTALYARFASRGEADFQGKVLSAMRYGFGGHLEKSPK